MDNLPEGFDPYLELLPDVRTPLLDRFKSKLREAAQKDSLHGINGAIYGHGSKPIGRVTSIDATASAAGSLSVTAELYEKGLFGLETETEESDDGAFIDLPEGATLVSYAIQHPDGRIEIIRADQ
jgi:hypothetical protein